MITLILLGFFFILFLAFALLTYLRGSRRNSGQSGAATQPSTDGPEASRANFLD
jgi:hypothetical protein